MPVILRTLGEIDVRCPDGRDLRPLVVQPKRIALLTYLAVASPSGLHRRDTLLGLLWPEHDTEHARASLRQSLHALRQALGPSVLLTRGDEVGLNPAELRVDVRAFEEAAASGSPESAVALYGGEFLPGLFVSGAAEFERWVDGERSRLRRLYGSLLERLAERTSQQDQAAALRWWWKLAEHDPYSPHVALGLMAALAATGDAPAALLHAERHETLLRDELGADPDPRVSAFAAELRKSRPARGALVLPPAVPLPAPAPASIPTPAEQPNVPPRRRSSVLVFAAAVIVLVTLPTSLAIRNRVKEPVSVAVFPFANLGEDRYEYLATGLSEAITSHLGMIGDLRVLSLGAGLRARARPAGGGVAVRGLRLKRVVNGSLAAVQDSFSVRVQLLDPRTKAVLHAREYGGSVSQLFDIQGQIARDLARALGVEVTRDVSRRLDRQPTRNFVAYEQYVRGWAAFNDWNRDGLDTAIAALERALAVDTLFAEARALLANAYLEKMDLYGPRADHRARVHLLTETARYLNPQLADVYVARGNQLWTATNGFPHEQAIAEFRHAAALQPSLPSPHDRLALIYLHIGLLDLALEEAEQAATLGPLDHWARLRVGHVLATQQKYEEALEAFASLPAGVGAEVRVPLETEALLYLGRTRQAIALLDRMVESMRGNPWVRANRALARARVGDVAGAEADIGVAAAGAAGLAHGHHAEFIIGVTYAVLGRDDAAVQWLRRAAENGWPGYERYARDPFLARLRDHPGYTRLLQDLRVRWEARRRTYGERIPAALTDQPA